MTSPTAEELGPREFCKSSDWQPRRRCTLSAETSIVSSAPIGSALAPNWPASTAATAAMATAATG